MPVDPILEPMLAHFSEMPHDIDDFAAFRHQLASATDSFADQLVAPSPPIGDVSDVALDVSNGEFGIRIYHPATPGPHPVLLFMHGGAWMVGSTSERIYDTICRERAALAEYIVVSVDYRLAPEHKFPTALNDCYAALVWVAEHAAEFGGNPDQVVVSGVSAGGNLAAALTLKSRDENGPVIQYQLLEVPATDLTWSHPSHLVYGQGFALSKGDVELAARCYLSDPADAHNPYASPLWAEDLSGLPPAWIKVAEYDVLRDEGKAYAERLSEAGVSVEFSVGSGHVHSSNVMTKFLPAARHWQDEVIAALQQQARLMSDGLPSRVGESRLPQA